MISNFLCCIGERLPELRAVTGQAATHIDPLASVSGVNYFSSESPTLVGLPLDGPPMLLELTGDVLASFVDARE
jgi:hypothetical protein